MNPILPENSPSVTQLPPDDPLVLLSRAELRRELHRQKAELSRQVWEYRDLREQLLNAKPAYKREYVEHMLEICQPGAEQRRIVRRLEHALAARAR